MFSFKDLWYHCFYCVLNEMTHLFKLRSDSPFSRFSPRALPNDSSLWLSTRFHVGHKVDYFIFFIWINPRVDEVFFDSLIMMTVLNIFISKKFLKNAIISRLWVVAAKPFSRHIRILWNSIHEDWDR